MRAPRAAAAALTEGAGLAEQRLGTPAREIQGLARMPVEKPSMVLQHVQGTVPQSAIVPALLRELACVRAHRAAAQDRRYGQSAWAHRGMTFSAPTRGQTQRLPGSG